MERKNDVYVREMGGWSNVELSFQPGWSTGPEDGKFQDGLSFRMLFTRPYHVGGLLSHRKLGRWNGGGVIPKEDALRLAEAIFDYYGKTPHNLKN